MAIVGIIGGLVTGMLLMFYRDVSAAERIHLLTSAFAHYRDEWTGGWALQRSHRRRILVGNEEGYEIHFPTYAGAVKAVTFSLGMVVLGSSLLLIPFSGQGISVVGWIIIGLVVGASVEHSVWLYARADFPSAEHHRSVWLVSWASALGTLTQILRLNRLGHRE